MTISDVLRATAAALTLLLPMAGHAQVGTVYCTNCSNWWDQANSLLKEIEGVQQEIQTAQNTLNFYTNAVQNTVNLPSSVYRNLTGDVQNMAGLLQRAQTLSGSATQLFKNISAPGGYPISTLPNWRAQFLTENQACSDGVTSSAQVLTAQTNQLAADAATLGSLQTEVMAADGRQQSLQSMGGILATIGQLTQKLQGAVNGGWTSTVNCNAGRLDRQALLDQYDAQGGPASAALFEACTALKANGNSMPACSNIGSTTFFTPGTDTPIN